MTKQICKRQMATIGRALALALACTAGFAGLAAAEQNGQTTSHTSLSVVSGLVGNHTAAIFTATVKGANGAPATGVVTLVDEATGDRPIASAALDATGTASLPQDSLPKGDYQISAIYSGDSLRAESKSEFKNIHIETTAATPDFSVAIAPTALTMAAGGSGTTKMTITPLNGFTGFLSLSCSGLPVDEISCTFTPINLQIIDTSAVTADLGVVTLAPGGKSAANHLNDGNKGSPPMLAILLPGIAALGFIGRKRKLFGRIALLALVGVLTIATTTACAARYKYLNHGPIVGGTPPGNYTITVTAQTSNGVTATEHSTTLAVTVK